MLLSEIKKYCYPEHKKEKDLQVSLWLYFVIRPASFYFTYIALKVKIGPNHATFIGFIIGLVSLILAGNGNYFLAALFLNIFAIIDCVDGNLARLKKPSKLGEYFDAISGDIINFGFFLVLLLSALNEGHFSNLENHVPFNLIYIIFAIGCFQILIGLTNQRFHNIFFLSDKDTLKKNMPIVEIILRNGFGAAFLYPTALIISFFEEFELLLIYLVISTPFFYIISLLRVFLINKRNYEK